MRRWLFGGRFLFGLLFQLVVALLADFFGTQGVLLLVEASAVKVPVGRPGVVVAQRLHAQTVGLQVLQNLHDVLGLEPAVAQKVQNFHLKKIVTKLSIENWNQNLIEISFVNNRSGDNITRTVPIHVVPEEDPLS